MTPNRLTETDLALAEIQRESVAGEFTERANELIGHAEAVASRLPRRCVRRAIA
jgi:hypothetical protein